ncbi:MAG: methylated-DNA--[protein]-cysteine S-methyltransferase [Bdellovibrionaceae bacterium]|nr:methylated-DNA--[protein]-cysteine S-methyltransferase [Bdellovibrio sp.]
MNTILGSLYLVASSAGLQGVYWSKQSVPLLKNLKGSTKPIKNVALAAQELSEYLKGDRKSFKVPLDLVGTDFQKKVWQKLAEIPYGETRSYKDIAKAVKNVNAFRAVGTANGKNPVCVFIPCHRVIAADGTLGGYSGGLDKKVKLLKIERSL